MRSRELVIPTANQLLKYRYRTYIRNALLAAIALHVAVFACAPPFQFEPYKLKEEIQLESVVVDDIDIPRPPPDVPQPPGEVIPDDGATQEEVPETSLDDFKPTPPPPKTERRSELFVPYDEPPVPIRFVAPTYPELAREAGLEGTVRIKACIGSDGRVKIAEVFDSDVTKAMEKAAIEAARMCVFKPATQRSRPVKAYVVIPFQFRLNR